MSWLNPYVLLAACLSLIGAAGGGYEYGYRAASNAAAAKKLAAVSRAIAQANAVAAQDQQISTGYEVQREKVRIVYRTITQEVDKYVDTHPDSHACGLDADGLRLWRAANASNASALPGGPDGAVPGAAAAGRRGAGDAAAQPRGGGAALPRLPGAPGGPGAMRSQQEQK